jgi:hypothetical protein
MLALEGGRRASAAYRKEGGAFVVAGRDEAAKPEFAAATVATDFRAIRCFIMPRLEHDGLELNRFVG